MEHREDTEGEGECTFPDLSRRQFLARLGLTAVIALSVEVLPTRAALSQRNRVLILGAGLADLCAAYELERLGYRVTLLEAHTHRTGGRVYTRRFGEGYGEFGAMRIPKGHLLTRYYTDLFKLPLRPFIEYNPNAYYVVGGQRKRIKDVAQLDPRYAVQGVGAFWQQGFDEIIGGMDRLPHAFLARLKTSPLMGRRVLRIEQEFRRQTVAAVCRHGERTERFEADFMVCTLPLTVLRGLPVDPPFSEAKRKAHQSVQYLPAQKVLVAVRERFWEAEDGIYGGGTYTDLLIGSAYYPSDNARLKSRSVSSGPGVLLGSYTLGKPSRQWNAVPPERRGARALHDLAGVHPQIRRKGMVREVAEMNWGEDPRSVGAFADPHTPDRPFYPDVIAPEGRIHFAGEHASEHPTWMQGALESARRCVREIVSAEEKTKSDVRLHSAHAD